MRLNITIVMATLSTTLIICVGYLAIAGTAKPRPDSYRAAVIQLLDQHQVDYRRVEVVDGCAPSYQFCQTYAGAVIVETERRLRGQIACRERWTTCTLTIRELGIYNASLPDVRDPMIWRWEQAAAAITRWLRGVR